MKSRNLIMIVLMLVCVSLVSGQSITSSDSNVVLNKISYKIDYSELNLTDKTYMDNTTNITISSMIDYNCTLNISLNYFSLNSSYNNHGSTSNMPFIIGQQLVQNLSDGYYALTLDCLYNASTNKVIKTEYINETDNTSYEIIQNDTNYTSARSISNKNITIDSQAPSISIFAPNNFTVNSTNITVNLNISDQSRTACFINITIDNTTLYSGLNDFNFTTNETTGNISINLTALFGNYTINVKCNDLLNNFASNAYSFNMNGITNTSTNTSINNTNTIQQPFFSITLDNAAINLGDIGFYNIYANNNSNVSITICPIAQGWVQCYFTPDYVNMSYPIKQAMPYSNKTGNYLIDGVMHYNNITLRANATLSVVNSLSASVTASATSVPVNTIITFNATVHGGIGNYDYVWVMDDNTKFIGAGAYKNFTTAGIYVEQLLVNDSMDNTFNTSMQVNVKPYYQLTVVISDSRTGSRLSGVLVSADNVNQTTDSNGQAVLSLVEGGYDIYASKDGYGGMLSDLSLHSDQELDMNLSLDTQQPPSVELLTNDGEIFTADSVKLQFQAHDIANVYCALYIANSNDSWYVQKDSGGNLLPDTIYTWNPNDLTAGSYKWRVECMDPLNNTNTSNDYSFSIVGDNISTTISNAANSIDNVNNALDNMNLMSGDEATVVDILGIKDALQTIIDKNNNLARDISNLAYRRDLNDSQRTQAQQDMIDSLNNLEQDTPIDLKVSSTKNYVKYARDDDIKQILSQYTSIKNLNLNPADFLQTTKQAQSKIIVSTKAYNIILYYNDGHTSELTLVVNDIASSGDLNPTSMSIVENIPKTLAPDISVLNMLGNTYTVLKSDPMLEYPVDTQTLSYYMNKTINLDDLQQSDTLLIDKNVQHQTGITGFSILGISSVSNLDGKSLMVIVVIVLILAYLLINFDIIAKIRDFGLGLSSKKRIKYITVLVNDSLDYMNAGDYDKAALIYREVKLNYETCPDRIQKQIFEECYDLCNKLDMHYFDSLYDEIKEYIQDNSYARALSAYDKLEKTYGKIDDVYKKSLTKKLEEIYRIIETIRGTV